MKTEDFTVTILVDQTAEEVFHAVNDVRGWWSEEIEGGTGKLNDEFLYHFKDVHIAKMRLIEVVPYEKVVWLVLDNHFNFIDDKTEWVGTQDHFRYHSERWENRNCGLHTRGLVPAYECYKICYDAWTNYITRSLYNLITTGKGQPNPKEGGFNSELLKKWKLAIVKNDIPE